MKKSSIAKRALRILGHDLTIVALAAVLLAVSAGVIAAARREPPAPTHPSALEAAAPAAAPELDPLAEPLPAPPPPGRVVEGRLDAGQTLTGALAAQQLPPSLAQRLAGALKGLFDFRRARPGHRYRVRLGADDELVGFRYELSSLEAYVVRPDGESWSATREQVELVPQVARIAGVVESSIHSAVVALGEEGSLAHDFAEIFAWDVDFSRDMRRGDEFQILYERLHRVADDGREVFVRPGRILAARFHGSAGELEAIYFEPEEGLGGYYRPDGSSVEGQFLRAPLRYSRISSSYTSARRHPILRVTRPHHGIDYAAPAGTAIWSVADGTVIYRGWGGGFGRLVKVRHANGFVSYYAHLSRYASGLSVGSRVSQKQVIGFVGQSGLATGPHVCFRVAKDGRYVNPAELGSPAGPPVPPDRVVHFRSARDLLLAELDGSALVAVEEAL